MEYLVDYNALKGTVAKTYEKKADTESFLEETVTEHSAEVDDMRKSGCSVVRAFTKLGKSLLLDHVTELKIAEVLFYHGETELAREYFEKAKSYPRYFGHIGEFDEAIRRIRETYLPSQNNAEGMNALLAQA